MIGIIVLSVVPLCVKEHNPILDWIEIIAAIAFLIDYVLRWLSADYKYRKISPKKAFMIYPFRFHAIIDFISILSVLPIFIPALKVVKWIKLIKCIRIFKLLKYSSNFNIIYVILLREKKALLTVGYIAIAYIFISALIVFQIEPETFQTFFDAIYWAVISLTTVGYGDLYPVSTIGRLFSMISAFFGIAFVALPAGIISAGYLQVVMEEPKDKE